MAGLAAPLETENDQVMARIAISADLLEAELLLEPGEQLTTAEALDLLDRLRVTHGILAHALENLGAMVGPVVVARGTAGIPAEDARILIDFPHTRPSPERLASSFVRVKQGQVLARRVPPKPPIPGVTVMGHLIQPPFAVDRLLKAGVGAELAHEGLALVASYDGTAYLEDDHVVVRRLQTLSGDVTKASGPIQFDGDVHVRGNVGPEAVIRATGSLLVEGDVRGAHLVVGKDLLLQGAASEQSVLQAGGDVYALSLDHVRLRAKGSLRVHGAMLQTDAELDQEALIGELIGGNLKVGLRGEVRIIGTPEKVHTKVWIVPPQADAEALINLEREQSKLNEALVRLQPKLDEARALEQSAGGESLRKLQDLAALLQQRELKLNERKRALSLGATGAKPTFHVRASLYPEVSLFIGNAYAKLEKQRAACALVEEGGAIRVMPMLQLGRRGRKGAS